MKAIIYYFTGTGNTQKVCSFIASSLSKLNCETDLQRITQESFDKAEYSSCSLYDIVGISYPIYGFNAPYLVNQFVKKLEKTDGKKAFIIKVSGEPFSLNSSSSNVIKHHLKKNGYNLVFEKHILMPYNIMFRYPDALVKQMYSTALSYAPVAANAILSGKRSVINPTMLSILPSSICKLVWIAGDVFVRSFNVDKNKCVKCGKCQRGCPLGNIQMSEDGYPYFNKHCAMCMQCQMCCPKNAIDAGVLKRWKVYPEYPFEEINKNTNIEENFVNSDTKGYFKLFLNYFKTINKEINDFKGE